MADTARLAADRAALEELRARIGGRGVEVSHVVADGFADNALVQLSGADGDSAPGDVAMAEHADRLAELITTAPDAEKRGLMRALAASGGSPSDSHSNRDQRTVNRGKHKGNAGAVPAAPTTGPAATPEPATPTSSPTPAPTATPTASPTPAPTDEAGDGGTGGKGGKTGNGQLKGNSSAR